MPNGHPHSACICLSSFAYQCFHTHTHKTSVSTYIADHKSAWWTLYVANSRSKTLSCSLSSQRCILFHLFRTLQKTTRTHTQHSFDVDLISWHFSALILSHHPAGQMNWIFLVVEPLHLCWVVSSSRNDQLLWHFDWTILVCLRAEPIGQPTSRRITPTVGNISKSIKSAIVEDFDKKKCCASCIQQHSVCIY